MKINLKLFGITKEIIGKTEIEFQISSPIDVSSLREKLKQEFPKLEDLKSLAIAVNGEYVQQDLPLTEDDEIVLIPPVSGG
ncbi:MoaD/ThiS family protein [Aliifodinibius sp. S!AR15-10]|uniref:MoaD/ThiS family protein n=1 Tax=Aliifodinibius sp. S!AR15-10 TaxID=2950437 RepID=UPI00285D2C82|nr:MoaD/ThiS family protein [Aliifodinibius sp. S!AR15-10]MDR8394141.1 MoaD/ThiS family protein [Aliifodinibius sp. S!AR15-10]